ncbi:MAG: DUF3108 domain-containing protein [Cyclobacteriaceae bacterium]
MSFSSPYGGKAQYNSFSPIGLNKDAFSFKAGEKLDYKISFGLFSAGEASMQIAPHVFQINGSDCYKIDFYGKTTGALSWVAKVDNNWGAYINQQSLLPEASYRKISENNYRKNEWVDFEQNPGAVSNIDYREYKTDGIEIKKQRLYEAQGQVLDLISGFSFLRNHELKDLKPGDRLELQTFFEDTIYQFQVEYHGIEEVKTKTGKFKAYKLRPLMPANKLFAGENPVTVWLSADQNKIPVRMEADFVVGKGKCILENYQNLKYKPTALK